MMKNLDFGLCVIKNKETNKKKTLRGLIKEGYYLTSEGKTIILVAVQRRGRRR